MDEEAEEFSIKHILHFPIVFWLLSFISLFSYSQIWMLMTFSTDYVHNEFEGYSTSDAAHVNSIMYGIPLVLSPIVGYFLQKTKLFVTTMTIGGTRLHLRSFFFSSLSFITWLCRFSCSTWCRRQRRGSWRTRYSNTWPGTSSRRLMASWASARRRRAPPRYPRRRRQGRASRPL